MVTPLEKAGCRAREYRQQDDPPQDSCPGKNQNCQNAQSKGQKNYTAQQSFAPLAGIDVGNAYRGAGWSGELAQIPVWFAPRLTVDDHLAYPFK